MAPFDAAGRDLTWSGPDPSCRIYVLRAGNQEIGGLRFEDESGSVATGRLDSREWIFEHSGSLHPRVNIRLKGSVEPLADVSLRWAGSGVITFAGGPCYCWRPANVLSTKWCLRRVGEEKLICFVQAGGLKANGARVVPCADCAELPEFPVLVLLGWYLRVLLSNRFVAAAVSCDQ